MTQRVSSWRGLGTVPSLLSSMSTLGDWPAVMGALPGYRSSGARFGLGPGDSRRRLGQPGQGLPFGLPLLERAGPPRLFPGLSPLEAGPVALCSFTLLLFAQLAKRPETRAGEAKPPRRTERRPGRRSLIHHSARSGAVVQPTSQRLPGRATGFSRHRHTPRRVDIPAPAGDAVHRLQAHALGGVRVLPCHRGPLSLGLTDSRLANLSPWIAGRNAAGWDIPHSAISDEGKAGVRTSLPGAGDCQPTHTLFTAGAARVSPTRRAWARYAFEKAWAPMRRTPDCLVSLDDVERGEELIITRRLMVWGTLNGAFGWGSVPSSSDH